MKCTEKEYLMLRTEIENNLKRQEAFFLVIFTILSVVNGVNNNIWNYKILLLISVLVFFLQLKILKSRNTVYYLLTYMIVFLENEDSNFHWETRLYKFRKMKYIEGTKKIKKKIISFFNQMTEKVASYINHFANLTLAGYLYFKIVFMVLYETNKLKIISVIAMATIIFILNIVYALKICFDKFLKERYLVMWKKLQKNEIEEKIK